MSYRDRPHWSYSAITQFLKCPLHYYFERVLGLPKKSVSEAQVLGSAVHEALAIYHRGIQAGESVLPHQVHTGFQDAWTRSVNSAKIIHHDGSSADDCLAQGIALIDVYLREEPPQRILAVEQEFLAHIPNRHGEYLEKPILAVVDLLSQPEPDDLKITEIKTSGRSYSAFETDTSLQPTCYTAIIHELTEQDPIVEFAVLVKTKTPKVQRVQTSRTAEDVGRLGDLIETIERAIIADAFYPVESPLNCSSCPYRRPCRDWGRSLITPESAATAIGQEEPVQC